MFSSEPWLAKSGGFYNGVATQSLRFDDGSSAFLSRTPSSAGNRKTWIWSGWLKRGILGGSHGLIESTSISFGLYLDKLFITVAGVGNGLSTAVFRDSSAWYHVLIAFDTTQASSADRVKFYVNGTQHSLSSTLVSQNTDYNINNTTLQRIGVTTVSGSTTYIDGYLSEVNFIDGLSFFSDTSGTPNTSFNINSFGETKNGVWIAKEYTGSYGTNGFRLQFNQTGTGTASTSTIGADTSGNTHHFTSSGIVASDCNMPDSPENNFCTYNPLYSWATTNTTLSEGNLKSTETGTAFGAKGIGTIGVNSGKWYFETHPHLMGNANYANIGVIDISEMTTIDGTGSDTDKFKAICYASYQGRKSAYGTGVDSNITLDGLGQSSYGDSWGATDIIGVALDIDNDAIYFSKNGTWQNSATSAEISAGTTTNSAYTGKLSGLTWTVAQGNGLNAFNFGFTLNAGQDATFAGYLTGGDVGTETPSDGAGVFKYAPPSGFLALCTSNLTEPTISPNALTQADDYFTPTLYTSDNIGAGGTQSITDVGFEPDWVWIKNRDASGTSHTLFDSVRTAGKMLQSDNTSIEVSNSQYGYLSSFDIYGFTLTGGTTNANFINQGTDAYVSWNWKAGGEPSADNSAGASAVPTAGSAKIDGSNATDSFAGTIPVTRLSANTTAGFSIVTYTGTGTAGTINHGLGVAPNCIIVMGRNVSNTNPYIQDGIAGVNDPFTDYIAFGNVNGVLVDDAGMWNGIAPDLNVFTVGSGANTNQSTKTYVAYLFSNVEGYSKFGSYTGNSSTDGTFVYTGFRPAWVIVKASVGSTGNWVMLDTTRDTGNMATAFLSADDSTSEVTLTPTLDILSNGFKLRRISAGMNQTNVTYIYMAFAEAPFKYANAR